MIVYRRKLKGEDIENLMDDEELIYYQDEDIAVTVNRADGFYIVQRKVISTGKRITESKLDCIGDVLEFAE
jgi:hypothetical protein